MGFNQLNDYHTTADSIGYFVGNPYEKRRMLRQMTHISMCLYTSVTRRIITTKTKWMELTRIKCDPALKPQKQRIQNKNNNNIRSLSPAPWLCTSVVRIHLLFLILWSIVWLLLVLLANFQFPQIKRCHNAIPASCDLALNCVRVKDRQSKSRQRATRDSERKREFWNDRSDKRTNIEITNDKWNEYSDAKWWENPGIIYTHTKMRE